MKLKSIYKKLLIEIYLQSLKSGKFGSSLDQYSKSMSMGKSLWLTPKEVQNYLASLEKQRLIKITDKKAPRLTPKGRKMIIVVMAGGTFDIIHSGHIETLRRAKELGDALVVSVARETTFLKNKKKNPIHSESMRRELVACVKYVDAAVLGSETNIYDTVRFLKPDVIALGYDQTHSEKAIIKGSKEEGIKVKVVRLKSLVPQIKTSKILSRRDISPLSTI